MKFKFNQQNTRNHGYLDGWLLIVEKAVDGEPEGLPQHSLVVVLHVGEVVQHPAGAGPRQSTSLNPVVTAEFK